MSELIEPPKKTVVTSLSPEQAAERDKHIGGSEVACLFGLGYQTELELWLEKAGQIDPQEFDSEFMKAGIYMEPGIAAWVADQTGYTMQRVHRYVKHKTVKGWGASLDYEIVNNPNGPGVAEIKRVHWFVGHRSWVLTDEEMEAPPHIEMQLQHQLGATGRDWGLIGADIGGQLYVVERDRDDDFVEIIGEKIEDFWESVRIGKAPEPNLDKDLKTLQRLYPDAAVGKVIELNDNLRKYTKDLELARAYTKAGNALSDAAKCGILSEIRDAEAVKLGDWAGDGTDRLMTAKVTKKKGYAVEPTQFRSLSITKVKPAKKEETNDA